MDATRRDGQFGLFPAGVLLAGRVVRRFSVEWLGRGDPRGPVHSPGVAVTHDHFDDLPHQFISMTGVSAAASAAAERTVDVLARMPSG